MFSPVPIGGVINPKQVYELYNGGGMEVMYQLDLTALEQVQEVRIYCLNQIRLFLMKYLREKNRSLLRGKGIHIE